MFDRIYIDHVDYNSLTVSLLNTRSLLIHAVDINRIKELMENDILCLTESQITNDTDGTEIFEQLSTLKVCFNSCGARHQNLAFCLGQNIVLLKHEAFPGISVIDIRKDDIIFTVMLLHRSPNSPLTSFYNTLETVLSESFIDMILGDFNIEIVNSININLKNVLSNLTLLVKKESP